MNHIKKHVLNKQFLYTICFIAFAVIDWTRGSQVGSIWAWTVNMTGVVMAAILFTAYRPREFVKPVYLIYSAVCIAALPLSYYWWSLHQEVIYRDKLLTAVLNIWLLGIFVIRMFLDAVVYKTKKLHFSKIEIPAAAMLLWMLFSRNEDVWPIWYLVMFGMFYHTEYSKEDTEALRKGMLNGIIAAFFLLQGAAFIFRPFDDPHNRYCGIYANCNINAMFYGIVWTALLMKLFDIRQNRDKKWKEILCFVFVGALTAFSVLTISKTAWVSMTVTGLLYVIFADFHCLEYKAGKFLEKLVSYLAVTLICIPVAYGAVRYLPPVFHHPVWYDGEYSEDRVHSFDPWDSEKYVSWGEFSEGVTERVMPYINAILGKYQIGAMTVKASDGITIGDTTYKWTEESTMDFASALGRVSYWEYYLKNGNMAGHLSSEGHDIAGPYIYVWHAQNMFVQLWYYYGIPSAVLFLAVLVMLVFSSIKKAVKGKEKTGPLCCQLYITFFGIFGLFEATWYPGQIVLLLAFFVPKFLADAESSMVASAAPDVLKPAERLNFLKDSGNMTERL